MSSPARASDATPSAALSPAPTPSSSDILQDLAHELRQPLSAIESIAYYLTLVLSHDDEKVHEQLGRLQQLVEQSDWILSNGLQVNASVTISPVPLDFEELLTDIIASQSWPVNCAPRLELAGRLLLVRVDPGLARALAANLLMLFRQLATESHPATVRTIAAEAASTSSCGGIMIEMETAAPGYGSEAALGPGGALSLNSARKIVAAHGGRLECTVDPIVGIRVRVMLP
jgi:signal transduction histidine kinase